MIRKTPLHREDATGIAKAARVGGMVTRGGGTRRRTVATCAILLPVVALSAWLIALPRHTRIALTDAATGRRIASSLLPDGERVILTWTNSLFHLPVTEVFVAGDGILTLTEITFADPSGREPARVRPEDVDDLYHTGGPFRAAGLSRPVRRVVFRVGEVGKPTIRVGGHTLRLDREVGFGGAVRLTARRAGLHERIAWQLEMLKLGLFQQPVNPAGDDTR